VFTGRLRCHRCGDCHSSKCDSRLLDFWTRSSMVCEIP